MAVNQALAPSGVVSITASTTVARAALVGVGDALMISNTTNGVAFVKFGTDNTVAATTAAGGADCIVPPVMQTIFTVPDGVTWAAVILASGATTGPVFFTRGVGTTR